MKKDIEEIKILLAEIQQRIIYIEECEERQSQRQRQRQSQTLQGMESGNTDPVTLRGEL